MDRRSFFKTIGGLSAAIALPVNQIAAILPQTWSISPVRWQKAYDISLACWAFRADCFIGKLVDETPEKISLENPVQLHVDLRSDSEELDEISKQAALRVLMEGARHKLSILSNS